MRDLILKYKGIVGTYHYNKEMKMFVGEVRGNFPFYVFKGSTLKALERDFHNIIDNKIIRR